jgi:hypothetical protein
MTVGVEVPENTILISAPKVVLRADNLTTRNTLDTINYQLRPNAQPSDNQIIQWNSIGEASWIDTPGGGGSSNAFINTQPVNIPQPGSVLVADGDDPFNSRASYVIQVQQPSNKVLISTALEIGDDTNTISLDGGGLTVQSDSGSVFVKSINGFVETQSNDVIILKSPNGISIRDPVGGGIATEAMVGNDFNISNSSNTDGNVNIDTNGAGRVKLNGNGLTLNETAIISNEGGYLFTRHNTGSLVYTANQGSITYQSPNPVIYQETNGYKLSQLFQRSDGTFSIINQNVDSSIELNAPNGGVQINTGTGLIFNGVGVINNVDADLQIGNNANVIINSKFNDVVINTESGKLLVNQGSEFQGDMTINKVDPQLNFNNPDYPTQQCNIAFESASQELIMEHMSPDLASKCNIRLGVNDINIQSSFTPLQAGNINIQTGTGYTFINQYKLPNINPSADGQLLSCNIDGESSWVSSPIPQVTYTYWVSNQGLDTNNGSIINTFLTVGRAITEANTLLDTDKVVINVMAGQYNEFSGITITKNNITINGGTSIPSQTVFDGIITYAIDNTGVADVASSLYGLTVRGVVYAGSSTNNGSYVLGACILGTLQDALVPIVNSYSLAGSRDITISNCVVYAYNTHALTTVSGRINATATLFTQSSLVLNNLYPLLEATGDGLISLFGCQCFSLNNQATNVPPIVSLANTIPPSSSHTFNSCTIQYVFGTVNTGTLNKVAIGCTNTVGISMLAYNNLIISEGTRISNGGVQYVIISKQGAGAVVLQYGQNLCGATVHRYPTAASKTQLVTAIA